jgi:toxin ParE1/3/4
MEFRLTITEAANQDMDEIFSYIINDLCNPKAAIDIVDAIEAKYEEVCLHPYMFEASRDKILGNKGYRRIPVQNYVILYKIDEKEKMIIIARIFYCGQNYRDFL